MKAQSKDLDFSKSDTITRGRRFDGTPRAIFTCRLIRESARETPSDVNILALDGAQVCPETVASEAWRCLAQTVDGMSNSDEERLDAYWLANFCLRILILKFPGYFEPEDLKTAASIASLNYFDGETPIEGLVLQFVRAYSTHMPRVRGHYDPVRHFEYEIECVRSEGMMGRVVEMFRQLIVLRKPAIASH